MSAGKSSITQFNAQFPNIGYMGTIEERQGPTKSSPPKVGANFSDIKTITKSNKKLNISPLKI